MLRILRAGTPSFDETLEKLVNRGESDLHAVEPAVRTILDAVRSEGDGAVLRFARQFERRSTPPERVVHSSYPESGRKAVEGLPTSERQALELAASRIAEFHEHQRDPGFRFEDPMGTALGTRVRPLRRVGVYAPGGKARYPSSVLMAAIPARVAGVREIVLASPLSGGREDDILLAAAYLSGVTTVVDAGGAQAIGALAFGTQTIERVEKIVGPGNIYVACAKRLVSGVVGIDSIAGPSEILVLADDEARPAVVAADLLSQAEHDEQAYPLLVCTSEGLAHAVAEEVRRQLETLPRSAIARASIEAHGFAFVVEGKEQLVALADRLAAEHLSIQTAKAEELAEAIEYAGAIFIGGMTPEAAGDYLAGPSHVLPTGGAVRYAAPLGVYDFLRRTSILRYSASSLRSHAPAISTLARMEGLEAHARAVEIRLSDSASEQTNGTDRA